ncbi:MAG: TlpA disulfide reductase family protein [Bacteroidota bacterium]
MRKYLLGNLILMMALLACQGESSQPIELKTGLWRFELQLQDTAVMPFLAELEQTPSGYQLTVQNDTERILVDEITRSGDSIRIKMPVFQSEFVASIETDSTFSGWWYEYSRGADYRVPFSAKAGYAGVFPFPSSSPTIELANRWATEFSPDTEDSYVAIGEFSQLGSEVHGTFLTETGDYRYLTGVFDGQELKLSTFDGSHAFLFEAQLQEDGSLVGSFFSGNHWIEPWIATPDPEAQLRAPDELTYLKPGYDGIEFAFPDLQGDTVRLSDERFQDKVVIVQLLGSWCPNCMDESKLFAQWYQQYQPQGLEIVGLAYERAEDPAFAMASVQRMMDRLGVEYPVLLAATTNDKAEAAKTLPMLNHVLSYPTSIYIDRAGNIRKIHTGYYGPGTGDRHIQFLEKYTAFLEKLLAE